MVVRAIIPVPIILSVALKGVGEICSAAKAPEAAVRVALISDASIQAIGYPVEASFRICTAEARAKFVAVLSGKLDIHFIPLF